MFSGLTATIVFKRRASYYIFQMYIPCVCITALSWVSFWVNHEAIPARVGLSITTVLTISYMRGSVNADMPRVSYLKSIDYFLLVSFVFIFFTLIEYVLVLKYSRKRRALAKKNSLLLSDDEMVGEKVCTVNRFCMNGKPSRLRYVKVTAGISKCFLSRLRYWYGLQYGTISFPLIRKLLEY